MTSKLTRLGYSEDWFFFDVLSFSDLDDQLKEFDKGDDLNTEHYRYKTFCKYLDKQDVLRDEVVTHLIELLKNDADQTMAASASIKLLQYRFLTKDQFETVRFFVRRYGEWVEAPIKKAETYHQG